LSSIQYEEKNGFKWWVLLVEQIKEKLKRDVGILTETYEGVIGKNLTEAIIKCFG